MKKVKLNNNGISDLKAHAYDLLILRGEYLAKLQELEKEILAIQQEIVALSGNSVPQPPPMTAKAA